MSRSRRKTPIIGVTGASSDKEDKQLANRKFRRSLRQQLDSGREEEKLLMSIKETSNVWDFKKDGKVYWPNPSKKDMRK